MASKIKIGWILIALGSAAIVAECVVAQYFSGRPFAEVLIYDRERPDTAATIEVGTEDLPMRAEMTAIGQRPMGAEGNTGLPRAQFVVQFGNGWAEQPINFDFPADQEISRLEPSSTTESFLLTNRQPGTWHLKLVETGFRQFKSQTITAQLRAGSRPVRKTLIGVGIAIGLPGLAILWWPSSRARQAD